MALHYEKWDGTGNDFVLVDGRQDGRLPSDWSDAEILALCDRENGVGSDGVVVATPNADGSVHVDFRNPDGSRSFCGNGTRSALAWAHAEGLVGTRATLHAVDGPHKGQVRPDGTPGISFRVLSRPTEKPPLVDGSEHAAFLDTGSPHHVEWLRSKEALDGLDLKAAAGPARHHSDYGQGGTNVNVVAPWESGLAIRTFERGVEAETLSCGTGVVAAALMDIARNEAHAGHHLRQVYARGGLLEVRASTDEKGGFRDVWLFGAARRVFKGTWAWALVFLTIWVQPASAGDLATQLTDASRVSVLTASPGEDLYSAFGHTAIRVFDPVTRVDWVFNYGTFVVDDGFYVRFVKGRMDYRLGVERFGRFQSSYLRQGRALHEHILNLGPEDVRALADYLEWNAQPEHATYAYDFFRDNCATRVISVLAEVFGERFSPGCVATDSTYLEALRPYTSGSPWSAWGMELILGAEASTAMPECGHAFLPDVLAHQLDAMTLDGQPLAFPREVIFPQEGHWHAGLAPGEAGRQAPALVMWFWALWIVLGLRLMPRDSAWSRAAARASLAWTAAVSALLSLLFVAMAVATDHNDTWWNADLVWALGGWLVVWVEWKKACGTRSEDLNTERGIAAVWTVCAVASVLVVPALRSELSWGESVVWATVGASFSVLGAVWTSLSARR